MTLLFLLSPPSFVALYIRRSLSEGLNLEEMKMKPPRRIRRRKQSPPPTKGHAPSYNPVRSTSIRCMHTTIRCGVVWAWHRTLWHRIAERSRPHYLQDMQTCRHIDTQTRMHIHTHTYIYIYTYTPTGLPDCPEPGLSFSRISISLPLFIYPFFIRSLHTI